MKLPQMLQQHTATIEELEGEGAYGNIYADPYEIKCYFVEKEKLTRDDEGNEVISSSQLHTSEDIEPKQQSKVTFNGKTELVQTTNRYYNALTGKLSNVEVMLE